MQVSAQNPVASVQVVGNVNLETEQVLQHITLTVGDDLDQHTTQLNIQQSIKAMFDTALFEQVEVESHPSPQGTTVVFRVRERPLVVEIQFVGNKKYKASKLKEELGWKDKDKVFLTPGREEKYRQKLVEFYHKKGFSTFEASATVTRVSENRAIIKFNVSEGRKLRVVTINFIGNTAFTDKELLRIMQTKRWRWYWWSKYTPTTLETDQHTLTMMYATKGYLDVEIDISRPVLSDDKNLVLTVRIKENTQYRLREIRFQGNEIFSTDELLAFFTLQPGDVLNMQTFQEDGQQIRSLYQSQGYLRARIVPDFIQDSVNALVDIEIMVYEGERFYLRDFRLERVIESADGTPVTAQLKTKPNVIRREFDLEGGDVLDWTEVENTERRLINLGYFARDESAHTPRLKYGFDLDYDPIVGNELADLVLRLEEVPTGSVSIGGGFASSSGASLMLEFNETNLFGRGYRLGFQGQIGQHRSSGDISLFNPHIYDSQWGAGTRIWHRIQQSYGEYHFRQKRTGGELQFTRHLSRYDLLSFDYSLEQINISDTNLARATILEINDDPSNTTLPLELREGTSITSALGVGYRLDTRDYHIFPRSGVENTIHFKLAGLGGDNYFWKTGMGSDRYYGLPWKFALAWKGNMALAQNYGRSKTLPIQDRLFGGGQNSVRGFEEGGISPVTFIKYETPDGKVLREKFTTGGEAQWTSNLELRYPLTSFIYALAFVDAGDVFREIGDIKLDTFRASTGMGVRINVLNSMIVRLDFGFPLKKEKHDSTSVVHFGFGGSF